jgi:fatty acid desaturase
VTATIPLSGAAAAAADAMVPAEARPQVLPQDQAEAIQRERTHRLKLRAGSIGIVAAVLVAIWALTGSDYPWFVWPLLALGLVAALDAWHVLAMPPISDAELAATEATPATPGDDAVRRLVRRRRLRHSAGALAILNLFLAGIWLASGAGYFWPAWVILGSLAAIGLKALPRPDRARTHLLGDHP